MRRVFVGVCSLVALGFAASAAPGCGSDNGDSTFDGGSSGGDGSACTGFGCGTGDTGAEAGCVGLQCMQIPCDTAGAKTTLSGTVYDPAGKVPIYNATVYVPNAPLADIPSGSKTCDRCDAAVSGNPIAITATDTSGHFTLENVPVASNVPLVVQIGKWRRQVQIPAVAKCVDTPVDPTLTRLPKNRMEGNIPRIALSTGGADPLQCLLRKMGVDDAEFGLAGSDSRIHLYTGGGFTENMVAKPASSKFGAALNGGANYTTSETLWGSLASLQSYDLVLLSCEGDENETTAGAAKPDTAKQALYDYAKNGGRVFASHYHEVWLRKSPDATVKGVATWADPERQPPAVGGPPATTAFNADISTAFPKAVAMNDWLTKQNALTGGKLPIFDARHNVDGVNAGALNWISAPNTNITPTPVTAVQYMSFNTPVGAADDAVCGRVVFSNLHVGAGQQGGVSDNPQAPFPDGCATTDLSAQQKALEFMLFDLSSCVQKDDSAIVGPR